MKKILFIFSILSLAHMVVGQVKSLDTTAGYSNPKVFPAKEDFSVQHRQIKIGDISIFYREAGDPAKETIVMLHGFPSSSHMYRNVIDALCGEYHIIAPDYPGSGLSSIPDMEEFDYTFDNVTRVMGSFMDTLGLENYYLMMQDYGGPVGFRIATEHPDRVKGLIIQNANAYVEGFGELSQTIGGYVETKQFDKLVELRTYLMSKEGIKSQYMNGTKCPECIDRIAYLTDNAFFDRSGVREVQSKLFDNYGSNVPKYAEWQSYFKTHQPPTIILWGENDKFFSKAGGEAYRRDLMNVEVHFFEGGHFMMEEYPEESVALIRKFLSNNQ